jgi:hypothetical protein
MNCKREENKKYCTCTYPCNNKGSCCECVIYHRNRNEIPGCFFSETAEKSYDRSIEAFIKDYMGKK